MGFAKEVRRHRSALGTNIELAVAEQAEYGIGTHVPTRPGERRISIHVLYLKIGLRIEQQLNGVFSTEGRRAMRDPHDPCRFDVDTLGRADSAFGGFECSAFEEPFPERRVVFAGLHGSP